MRKSILILLMCLWMTHHYAQKVLPQLEEPLCAEHIQYPELDKFVGTWIGEKGGKRMELVLKKSKLHAPTIIPSYLYDECVDVIYGFHKFMDNEVEIENVLSYSHSSVHEKGRSILAGIKENDPRTLKGTIIHKSKKRSVNFVISYIDAQHIKIVSLEKPTGIRIVQPGEPTHWTIDFPEDIILTKQ